MHDLTYRSELLELMDDPAVDPQELAENFADIEFANRYLGGYAPVIEAVERFGARTILDVGTGSGDVPRALLHAARGRGVSLQVLGVDRSAAVIDIARRAAGDLPDLRFERAEGAALPYADASFDVVTCNLTLHHCRPEVARTLLREMRRVARLSPVVSDLRRSFAGYVGARVATRVLFRNRLTRSDGPLSVRRAYTPDEALVLAREAGWGCPRVGRRPFFRMLLTDG